MTITEITEENISVCSELLPAELRANLEREYFRGLYGEDDGEIIAVIIWELKGAEDEKVPTKAEILCFTLTDTVYSDELMQAFDHCIREEGVEEIGFELSELNDIEMDVLSEYGFDITEAESIDIRVSVSDLTSLDMIRKDKKLPAYIKSLSDITARQYKAAIMTSVFHGRYGLLDDLPFLPMTRFDPDISSCIITDEKVNGLILVHKTMDNEYIVELLFAMQPDANINLLNMMRFSTKAASRLCTGDETVILRMHNTASADLINKLFPDSMGEMIMKGERKL